MPFWGWWKQVKDHPHAEDLWENGSGLYAAHYGAWDWEQNWQTFAGVTAE